MQSFKSIRILTVSIAAVFTVAGCNNLKKSNSGDIQEVGDSQNNVVNQNDQTAIYNALLTDLAQNSLWSIKISEIASQTSGEQKIKDLAALITTDHQSIYSKTQGLAQQNAISVAGDLEDFNKQKLLDLQKMKSTGFDSAYCALITESTQRTESLLNSLSSQSKDTAIKEWSNAIILQIKEHQNISSNLLNSYRKQGV